MNSCSRNKYVFKVILSLFFVFSTSSLAQSITIDFEGYSDSTIVKDLYLPQGIIFAVRADNWAWLEGLPSYNGPIIIDFTWDGDNAMCTGPLRSMDPPTVGGTCSWNLDIRFVDPNDINTTVLVDNVSLELQGANYDEAFTVFWLNKSGNIIGSQTTSIFISKVSDCISEPVTEDNYRETFTAPQEIGGIYIRNNTFGYTPCGHDRFSLDNITFDAYVARINDPDKDLGCNSDSGRGNPCDASTGNKYQREVDYSSPNGQLPIVRHYNSQLPIDVGFGVGWTSRYTQRLEISNGVVRARRENGSAAAFVMDSGIWEGSYDGTLVLTEDATGYTVTLPTGVTERYSLTGQLLSENRRGHITTYSYDGAGQLEMVTGPYGHSLSFAFNAGGHVESITLPGGMSIQYGYDANNNLTAVTYQDLESRTYHYEEVNFPNALTGITDESNVRFSTYDYDDTSGKAIGTQHAQTDNGGPQESFSLVYDSATQTAVTDPAGTVEVMTFEEKLGVKNLINVANQSDLKNLSQSFDANNNLVSRTNEEDETTTYTYNQDNQRTAMTEASGTSQARTTTYQYFSPSVDLITGVQRPSVYVSGVSQLTTTYDANLHPDLVTHSGFQQNGTAITRVTDFDFDSQGKVVRIDGPRADVIDVTQFSYHACTTGNHCGQLHTITNAKNQSTTFDSYDSQGRLTQMTDPNGMVTQYGYDAGGRLTSISETPSGGPSRTTGFTYHPTGLLNTVATPQGLVLTHSYDAAQYLRSITDNLGNRIDYAYDLKGNRTEENIYDPLNTLKRARDVSYDLRDRISTITEAGNITQLVYDAVGNMDTTTDGNLNITDHDYDPLNRLTQTLDALTGFTYRQHDVQDNVTQVQAPNGVITQFEYDDLGNLLQEISPDRGSLSYSYDPAGNLMSKTDAKGVVTNFSYDELNRPTQVNYPATPLDNISYSYDGNAPGQNGTGRLTSVTNQHSVVTYFYDGWGRVSKKTEDIGGALYTFQYAYNADSQLTQITYPSGRIVNYFRDIVGQLSSVTTQADAGAAEETLASNIGWMPFGPLNGLLFGNGHTLSHAYDSAYRLTDVDTDDGDTLVQDLLYGYDGANNITGITDSFDAGQNQTFSYDALNRLDTALGDYGTLDYDLDANGNRTTLTADGLSTSYSYAGISNRLATETDASDTWTYGYDNNGNITSKALSGGSGFIYNYAATNRLIEVVEEIHTPKRKGKGSTVEQFLRASYDHNALGQRILKATDAVTVIYLYGTDGKLLVEVDDAGNRTEYIYLGNMPLAIQQVAVTSSGNPPPSPVIIDNGEAGTSFTGSWASKAGNNDYGDGFLLANSGASNTYTWVPTLSDNGQYEVYAWWSSKGNYSDNVPYTITHAGQQDIVYADHSANGGQWNLLGTFDFSDDGTESVQVSAVNGKTVSDALKFVKIVPPEPPSTVQARYYIHVDHLGTPKRLTDQSGQIVWSATQTPFGVTSFNEDVDGDGTNVTLNLRLPGQYYDKETGLHYNYFRDYDPSLGRYIQSDPIGLQGGINTYGYVGGNPLIFYDPNGLDSKATVGDAAGAFSDAGPMGYAEAVQARKDAQRAVDAILSEDLTISERNASNFMGPADAIRHCVLACSLTRRLGRETATSILNRHEEREKAEDPMDNMNNMMGCFLGENSTQDCQSACISNLNNLMSNRDSSGNIMSQPKPIGEIK